MYGNEDQEKKSEWRVDILFEMLFVQKQLRVQKNRQSHTERRVDKYYPGFRDEKRVLFSIGDKLPTQV